GSANAAQTVVCSPVASAIADANCQAAVLSGMSGVRVRQGCRASSAITLGQSPTAGTMVGLGTQTITVTATDAAGNSASCTTTFTVTNSTVPTVICPAVPGASADANCQATVPNVLSGVTATGNCSGTNSITLSQ